MSEDNKSENLWVLQTHILSLCILLITVDQFMTISVYTVYSKSLKYQCIRGERHLPLAVKGKENVFHRVVRGREQD